MNFPIQRPYTGQLKGVIFDWAGTTVDHGCFAPTMVFVEGFRAHGIEITLAEARQPMGKHKRDHIAEVLFMPRVSQQWRLLYGRMPTDADVQVIFEEFIPRQIAVIADYARPMQGVVETINHLKSQGVKIGSCTGYTRAMMDALLPIAHSAGYVPDCVVTGDDVPHGRPTPWMAIQNAMNLNLYPFESIVKVGDTVTDIEEGLNAGMWTVAVAQTGNEMGLNESELAHADPTWLEARTAIIHEKLYGAGAHYVINRVGMEELLPVLDDIEARLSQGERP